MAFKVNGSNIINDSFQVSNIIATTAEAQAGTNNDQLMTPLRVKEAIQGGISVIKSIQRFSIAMGSFSVGGVTYYTFGASSASTGFSHWPGGASVSSQGSASTSCFINLSPSVSLGKSFLTATYTGDYASQDVGARLYNNSGSYSGNSVQLTTTDYIIVPSGTQYRGAPMARIEVVEFY
jgi:hypothetical protein